MEELKDLFAGLLFGLFVGVIIFVIHYLWTCY